jgi:uncharacterized protein (TIGR03083 family)
MTAAPTHAELLDIWQEALESIVAVAEPLAPKQWSAQTDCPGWTVADVVAHVIDIEQLFGGEPRPEHEPDWTALTHVQNDFGRVTEVGVDHRRGTAPADLLDELRATIGRRRAQLDALPADAQVFGPSGGLEHIDRFLRTRTFDTWVHEQDIRWATGNDGGWTTAPAAIALQQMVRGLPYVWGKSVGAPPGSVLRLSVIGPDLHVESLVTVDENGRGIPAPDDAQPDVDAEMTWAAYMRLSCGRVSPDDPWLANKVEVGGLADLAAKLLPALAITP